MRDIQMINCILWGAIVFLFGQCNNGDSNKDEVSDKQEESIHYVDTNSDCNLKKDYKRFRYVYIDLDILIPKSWEVEEIFDDSTYGFRLLEEDTMMMDFIPFENVGGRDVFNEEVENLEALLPETFEQSEYEDSSLIILTYEVQYDDNFNDLIEVYYGKESGNLLFVRYSFELLEYKHPCILNNIQNQLRESGL